MAPLILGLCRYPDDCKITEEVTGSDIDITITPHRADFRVVCGKQGRQIKALQYFAKRAGEMSRPFVHGHVRLEEGTIGEPEAVHPFRQDPQFDVHRLLTEISHAAAALFGRTVAFSYERQCDKLIVELDTHADNPEDVPSAMCLSDLFYPACFRRGMLCEIRPARRLREPVPH